MGPKNKKPKKAQTTRRPFWLDPSSWPPFAIDKWPQLAPFNWFTISPEGLNPKAGKQEASAGPSLTIKTPIDMETEITRETPLVQMTAGQLADFLNKGAAAASPSPVAQAPARRYVYGLKGIMQLFNVSNVTAQRYKNGIIKAAVSQNGRKIVIDADKALELFKAARATDEAGAIE